MANREIREAARKERLRREKEQRIAERQTPEHQLYLKVRDQILPRKTLDWAREAITSEIKPGYAVALAQCSAYLLKDISRIYLDETLTEAEKEAAYNKACKEYREMSSRHFTVRPNYFEGLLAEFKKLV